MGPPLTSAHQMHMEMLSFLSDRMLLEAPFPLIRLLKSWLTAAIQPLNIKITLGAFSLPLFKLWGWLCLFAGFSDTHPIWSSCSQILPIF